MTTSADAFNALYADDVAKTPMIVPLQALVDTLTAQKTRLLGNVFRPSDFCGPQYIPGVDVTADMYALQKCFCAAMNTAGGTAALGGFTYLNVESGYYFNTWVRNIASCFNLKKPLTIEGEDATLKLARMPILYPGTNTGMNWLHFGVGYDIAVDPPYNSNMTQAQIDAQWHYTHGYIVRNLNFDSSLLTPANLARLSNSVTGGLLELAGAGFPDSQGSDGAGATLENLHADISWGVIGIGSNARSNRLIFRNITFDQVYKVGMWVDGARNSLLDTIACLSAHPNAGTPSGAGFEPNTDCFCAPRDNIMQNCRSVGMHIGFAFGGVNTILQNSSVVLPATGLSPIGVSIGALANSNGLYPTQGGKISGIDIQRDPVAPSAYGYAISAAGNNNAYGQALVDGVEITQCTIGKQPKKMAVAFNLGAWVNNTNMHDNDVQTSTGAAGLPFDASGGNSHNNVFSPNTVH